MYTWTGSLYPFTKAFISRWIRFHVEIDFGLDSSCSLKILISVRLQDPIHYNPFLRFGYGTDINPHPTETEVPEHATPMSQLDTTPAPNTSCYSSSTTISSDVLLIIHKSTLGFRVGQRRRVDLMFRRRCWPAHPHCNQVLRR